MVYRTSADPSAGEPRPADDGPLLALAADGRRGGDGAHGASGTHASDRGSDGGAGGDAGPAQSGENGGTIAVTLCRDDRREAMVRVTGEVTSGALGKRAIDTELNFHRAGHVELAARGGRGGDGGHGGDGGNGARGRPGKNATRHSSGANGGTGGDGGDGGNGTSGERGGEGGTVRVRVTEHDTPFLLLVRDDLRGGPGGASGANGSGGAGGSGGPGGRSYSWWETEQRGTEEARTTLRSNPGGSDGSAGRSGRSGNAVLRAGSHGAPGRLAIEVTNAAGAVQTYPSCFDVRLRSFRHRDENGDGVYEPEEKVFVTHVEVENVGGMPLPAHHDVVVRVVDDGWIAPVPETKLTLPRSLSPGQRHVFLDEELPLELRVFRPQATGKPLAAPETIRLFAELPRVRRRFETFEGPENEAQGAILIRFPIEVSKPTALVSLAPGEATRVRWKLSNVSKKAFGSRTDVGRAVGVKLVLGGGEVGERGIHFIDDDENLVSLGTGFDRDVPYLEAEGAQAFEGTIAVPAHAVPHTSARLVVSAELGHIDDPTRVRAVHYQEITVQVGRPFDATGADVLLVVNHRTNVAEVAAWESRIRSTGLSVSVWDASLEGGVDVLERLAKSETTAKYDLVVLLNDELDTPAGARRASSFVDQETTLTLARRGTHVLYVGEVPALETLLVPTGPIGATDDAGEGLATPTPVKTWFSWPWSAPRPEPLEARAKALAASLAVRFPERRYVVVHDFAPEVEKKVAWLRQVRLGTLTIRRSLDSATGALQGVTVDPSHLHQADFVDAAETNELLLRALPFAAKLRLLDHDGPSGPGVTVSDGCADPVVAAILETLLEEQSAALAHGWRRSKLDLALPLLRELASTGFASPVVPAASPRTRRLVELAAWLELIARDHPRSWEWLPPLAFLRRGPQLRRLAREAVEQLVARVGPDEETNRAITTRRKELRAIIARRRKNRELPTSNAGAFARDRLAARLEARVTETDVTALPQHKRVVAGELHTKLAAKERQRSHEAGKVRASTDEARRALLREESCDELLARARKARVAPVEANEALDDEQEGSAAGLGALRATSPSA